VEHPAVRILNSHRIMSISTVRPDGWPQTTIVGYANRGFEIVFMIFRASQKFTNIQHDNRVSVAVAAEPRELEQLTAVYAGGEVEQITDERGRGDAWRLLMERHSNLAGFKIPDDSGAAFMKLRCKYVSLLDFTQGVGHREQLVIDEQGAATEIVQASDSWGLIADTEQGNSAPSH